MLRPERLCGALLGLALCAGAPAQDAPQAGQPRPFGYTVGDLLEQNVAFETSPGWAPLADSLPRPGRAGAWLERRSVELVRLGAGRHALRQTYQFINAPEQVTVLGLPAFSIVIGDGRQRREQHVAEWPVTVSPLTPPLVLARAGLEEMRPDHAPQAPDTQPLRRRLALYALGLALAAGALALARYGLPFVPASRGPFARAWRPLRRLARRRDPQAYREALQLLHRALDQSAGRTLAAAQLESFLRTRPRFAAARADLERFYAFSREEFFGAGRARAEPAWLLGLCRRCRRLERRTD